MAVEGANEFLRRLQQLQNIKRDVVELVDIVLSDVETGAIRDAPPGIRERIQKSASNGGLQGKIEVNAKEIGAYIEFGTGQSAAQIVGALPPDWQEIARRFYINGRGTIIGQPYLYPNWFRYTNTFDEEIRDIVKQYE